MIHELQTLASNGTLELVPLPSGKKIVGCSWIYC